MSSCSGATSQEAKELLQKFLIGTLKPAKKKAPATTTAEAVLEESLPAAPPAASQQPPLLQLADPRTKYALPLVQKQQLNQDTFFLRFALASPQTRLGLPCGKHVYLFADIGGETVARAYTPVSGDKDLGVLDFLIKVGCRDQCMGGCMWAVCLQAVCLVGLWSF